ncbi:MAG: hypothetical protein ABIJ56_07325 [Pseudomonadota bacterium]
MKGKATFDFMQTDENLSASTENAFCAGTTAHLVVHATDPESPLPAWDMESGDDNVITVDEILDEGQYPAALGMGNPGIAELRILDREGGDLIDYVELAVAEPEGFAVLAASSFLMAEPAEETIIISAGTSQCNLYFYPFDTHAGEERFLFGEYDVNVRGDGPALRYDHKPIHVIDYENDDVPIMPDNYYEIEVTSDAAAGESVVFEGPKGLEAAAEFRTVEADEIDELDIAVVSLWGVGEGRYVTEFGAIVAVQKVDGKEVCGGFPVFFETDNEEVVQLLPCDIEHVKNATLFSLPAVGTATVTARLEADPTIQDTFTFTVEEQPEDE